MDPATSGEAALAPGSRALRGSVWLVAALLGLAIPLVILRSGYLPEADALRHVAKALSGKPWGEILVLEEGYGSDEHPGWHALLGALHRLLGWGPYALLAFSVVAPFALYWLAHLAWRRRPEAALAALLFASVAAPASFGRTLLGRPFALLMGIALVVLQLWARAARPSARRVALTIALIGVSVWVHGSWYLFGIPVAAFALAGERRKSLALAGCWLAGVLLGAALTGQPLEYLRQTTVHLFDVFGQARESLLVTELRSNPGDVSFLAGLGLVLLWRVACGAWRREVVLQPVFALAALGWLLGLKSGRFWTDWGFPAAILWLATELEERLEAGALGTRRTALLAAFVSLGVTIATTRDLAGRYSPSSGVPFLAPEDPTPPNLSEWMPEKGGILYSASLDVFFHTFYRNPRAEWRYMLGFEPGILPREDRKVLRDIQRAGFAPQAFAPWVRRMRPADRLFLLQSWKPDIGELEWYFAGGDLWIGRLPRRR